MKKSISILGGGTAALCLAAALNADIFDVTIFEKKGSLARKFLVAGDGGFNLTHSENLSEFKSRYTPNGFLDTALDHFSNADFRSWLLDLSIPTFVGSSKRIFPEKGIKPIDVLKTIEDHLVRKNVKFRFKNTFIGWDNEDNLKFDSEEIVKSDYVVFALGGASWKVTGSDGQWMSLFEDKGIQTIPFKSSNCAFKIDWEEKFLQKHKGTALKNISISINKIIQKGEVVITEFGLEGNAIYGLSPQIQSELTVKKDVVIHVDFKPTLERKKVLEKLSASALNVTTTLKDVLKLNKATIDLVKITLTKEEFLDTKFLANVIKNFPLTITEAASLDEAISTSGGIDLAAVNSNYELKSLKHQFCIGEMLDWDAPTGGYLIQACASMGFYLGDKLNNLESQME